MMSKTLRNVGRTTLTKSRLLVARRVRAFFSGTTIRVFSEVMPFFLRVAKTSLTLPSLIPRESIVMMLLSVFLIERACITATFLAFLERFLVKFSLPVRPPATPPWRQIGLRVEPKRARPVPFCFHGFLPPPRTSPRFKVLACELRELARYAS